MGTGEVDSSQEASRGPREEVAMKAANDPGWNFKQK